MIDTSAKRNSAITTRRLPWFRRFAPIPDGTVDQGDRQQMAFVYRGFATVSIISDHITGTLTVTPLVAGRLTIDLE